LKRLLVLALLIVVPTGVYADQCLSEFTYKERGQKVFKVRDCVYSSGRSGYYELVNLTGDQVKACWTIMFNNGKQSKGCRTMRPREQSSGSCFSCAPKNSGVSDVRIRKFLRQ